MSEQRVREVLPKPAALSAEMLGEEDREGLKMLKTLARSRIYELKNLTTAFDRLTYSNKERAGVIEKYERAMSIIDRLLDSADAK